MDSNSTNQGPVGIKDIAKALGVSIGTVDRALHSRGRISPPTRDRVLKMARTLGYKPNLAARYLKSPRQLRISVNLPGRIASFYDAIRTGVLNAAAPFDSAVDLCFRTHPILGEGETELLKVALEDGSRGIILAPGHPAQLRPWIRRAAEKQIPVVCVATDAPETERLTVVSADPFASGAIAGELLARLLPRKSAVAVVTGDLSTADHSEKLRGFRQSLSLYGGPQKICAVIETHDKERIAYRCAKELLERETGLRAIYANTANSIGVIRAAEETDPDQRVLLITTDLFPEIVPALRSGRILATIHQQPQMQGRLAFEALYRYLSEGLCPPARIRLNPQIIMRSNVDLLLPQLTSQPKRPGPDADS